MLVQLHHAYRDCRTEFVAQFEIPDDVSQEEGNRLLHEWIADVKARHPLPEGEDCEWLLCDEDSPGFVWAARNVRDSQ